MTTLTIYRNSIRFARKYLAGALDHAHDISHAERVARNVALIGRKLGYKDISFLSLCAWWHDAGRTIDDSCHEKISAELLKNDLLRRGSSVAVVKKAYAAVRHHRWSMRPCTLEGKMIYDADKLDFISIERWKKCLKAKQNIHPKEIAKLLPRLEKLFHFDESRAIYRRRLPAFMKFYSGL